MFFYGSILVGVILGCLLLALMLYNAFTNEITTEDIVLERFPLHKSPLHVLYISDIHNRVITDAFIAKIPRVDAVIIGGDLRDQRTRNAKIEKNIEKLSGIATVYFIWGNNDYEGDKEAFLHILKKWNVQIVGNEVIRFTGEWSDIQLAAVEDMSMKKDNVQKVVNAIDPDSCCIFVSHDPRLRRKCGSLLDGVVDLMLSGHTHGGQIRIAGFGPYSLGGMVQTKPFYHFISNGFGTSVVPLRLGTKGQAHLLTIRAKHTQKI